MWSFGDRSTAQYFIHQGRKIYMTYLLNNIDEAVDRKFLVCKNISNQARAGTMVHIMGSDDSSGINVKYRVTDTGQDYNIQFDTLKDFCKWAAPDTFIARYYENFSNKEILHYIKVTNRSFASFCLPIIAAALVVVWVLALVVLKGIVHLGGGICGIIGGVLSVVAIVAVIYMYRQQKSSVKLKLYRKVSSNWGIEFK